jgi:hypothetical protein
MDNNKVLKSYLKRQDIVEKTYWIKEGTLMISKERYPGSYIGIPQWNTPASDGLCSKKTSGRKKVIEIP